MCSASARPVAACTPGTTMICWNGAPGGCTDGFVSVGASTCTGTCVEGLPPGTCAFCTTDTAVRDDTCAAGARTTCYNDSVYDCECGLRAGKAEAHPADCAPPNACVTAISILHTPDSFCARSSSPDPQCADASSYPLEGGVVRCLDGYALEAP